LSELTNDPVYKEKVLSEAEFKAIRKYTGTGYRVYIERILKDTPASQDIALESGLAKLPGWKGLSYRGVRHVPNADDFWQKWTSGQWATVSWKAPSSSSVNRTSGFGRDGGFFFVIKNKGKQGAYVGPLSSHASEQELLFHAGSKFRVVGWSDEAYGHHKRVLILEEIDKPIASQVAPIRYTHEEVANLINSTESTTYFK
jgi:hypothetical protein